MEGGSDTIRQFCVDAGVWAEVGDGRWKRTTGEAVASPVGFYPARESARELGRAEDRAAEVARSRRVGGVADDEVLRDAERAIARDDAAVGRGSEVPRLGRRDDVALVELVAVALDARAREGLVDVLAGREAGDADRHVAVARHGGGFGAAERAERADGRRLVGGRAGLNEAGNRDGRDNADDRDDDQQLDERETFLILHVWPDSLVILCLGRAFGNLFF